MASTCLVIGTSQSGLNGEFLRWAFTTTYASNWHPLTWISHAIDCQLYGTKAALGHHITNLILHIASSVILFYFICLALTRASEKTDSEAPKGKPRKPKAAKKTDARLGIYFRAFFVAALFAVHPLHVESVAWIAERKDVLSTFFWMVTLVTYVRYVARPGWKAYPATVLAYAMGLLSKPMLVSLPFVLLLLDYWPLGRSQQGWRRLVLEKTPFFAMAGASCVVTLYAQATGGAVAPMYIYTAGMRVANALISYWAYIGKMLWPVNLAVMYPHPEHNTSYAMAAVCGAALVLVTAIAVKLARSRPYLIVGWLWYLITLVPVIGIVQAGFQAMADRYTYIPLVGLSLALAWGIPDLPIGCLSWPRVRIALAAAAGAIVLILAVCTSFQLVYWHDTISLFTRATEAVDNNTEMEYNLGTEYLERGDNENAVDHLRKAACICNSRKEIFLNLGNALLKVKEGAEAEDSYLQAIRLDSNSAEAHHGYAEALAMQGKFEQAVENCTRAIDCGRRDAQTYCDLSSYYFRLNRFPESHDWLTKAVKLDPRSERIYIGLGLVDEQMGRADEAFAAYSEAARVKPDDGIAYTGLASCCYSQGRYAKAWDYTHAAARTRPVHEPRLSQVALRKDA